MIAESTFIPALLSTFSYCFSKARATFQPRQPGVFALSQVFSQIALTKLLLDGGEEFTPQGRAGRRHWIEDDPFMAWPLLIPLA
jgi:hypothetical protein